MEKFNEKPQDKMLDIWFFVGIILIAYGVILTSIGIYYIFKPYTNAILGNLNPNLWWGGVMIISGIILQLISYNIRKKWMIVI